MVQDLVNKFWCQNSGEEIHIKLRPTPKGNMLPGDDYSKQGAYNISALIPRVRFYGLGLPGYFCCAKKRLRSH